MSEIPRPSTANPERSRPLTAPAWVADAPLWSLWVQRVLWLVVATLAGYVIYHVGAVILQRLHYPYDLEWM